MTAAKKNLLDEDENAVEPKTDNKVVETPEDKAGTTQDKNTAPVVTEQTAEEKSTGC